MKAKVALLSNPTQLRETLLLLLLTGSTTVLATLDQCTRGPSLTAMFLTHLQSFC